MSHHWYALKSRQELFTAEMLREAGYVAYVPCETLERKICRRLVLVQRPLYRGYVFVCCDNPETVRGIGASLDLVRFTLPSGERAPLRLPLNALVPVVLAEAYGEFDRTRAPEPYAPARGDWIRIAKGLWAGYFGRITSVGKSKIVIDGEWCVMETPLGTVELAA